MVKYRSMNRREIIQKSAMMATGLIGINGLGFEPEVERKFDIKIFKELLIKNGISVEDDATSCMGVFDNGDPFYVRTIRAEKYDTPEQHIVNALLKEGASKLKFYIHTEQKITVAPNNIPIGRNKIKEIGVYYDLDTFEPKEGMVTKVVNDIIRFATDKDIVEKLTEEQLRDIMKSKKEPYMIEETILSAKNNPQKTAMGFWLDRTETSCRVEKLPFQLIVG